MNWKCKIKIVFDVFFYISWQRHDLAEAAQGIDSKMLLKKLLTARWVGKTQFSEMKINGFVISSGSVTFSGSISMEFLWSSCSMSASFITCNDSNGRKFLVKPTNAIEFYSSLILNYWAKNVKPVGMLVTIATDILVETTDKRSVM